jgi:hypothetical protein
MAPGYSWLRLCVLPPEIQALTTLLVDHLVADLSWILVKTSPTASRKTRAMRKRRRMPQRFALWRLFGGVWLTALPRADFDWLRNRAGGRPNSRLKARLNAGSDS